MFTSSPRQKTTASRSPSLHLTLNLGRAAYSTTWRYWAVGAVLVGVVAADGAANVVVVVLMVVVVVEIIIMMMISSVHFKMVSMRLENPICAPLRLSEVSPTLPLKRFQCLSDKRRRSLVLSRKIV